MYIRLFIKTIRNFGSSDRIVGFVGSDRIGSSPIRTEKSDDPIRSVYIPIYRTHFFYHVWRNFDKSVSNIELIKASNKF